MTVSSPTYLTGDEATDLLRAMAIAVTKDLGTPALRKLDAAECSKVVWAYAFDPAAPDLAKRFGPLATMLAEFVTAAERFGGDDAEPERPAGLYERLGHVLEPTYDPDQEP